MTFETVPVEDLDQYALLSESAVLLDRKLADGLSRADAVRLTWIRWQLERIVEAAAHEARNLSR